MTKKNLLLLLLPEKLREALTSVAPITGIVLLLGFTVAPISTGALSTFTIGALLLITGMALFTMGAEMAMTPMGERVGVAMTKSRKLWLMLIGGFVIGAIVTVSEPDLTVLAAQVPAVPDRTLILFVAIGVGAFLVVALLRIIIGRRISHLLLFFYALVFILACFAPLDFLAVAFDAGGVTTGPMTVPFIMSLGVGIASIRSDRHAEHDSFGMVALCSIGPILAVLILGLAYRPEESVYTAVSVPVIANSRELGLLFLRVLPKYLGEVAVSLAPIVVFFVIFQIFFLKLPKRTLLRYIIGLGYTYIGLVLFLTGVNVGFMPVGIEIGALIGESPYRWLLIPIGGVIGYFTVAAEPAVHVLNRQVETITAGAISGRSMSLSLAIGVCIAVALAMVRVLTGISILWFLVPGYVLALALTFFVPRIFTSIAFDSGGVASGPMTATFVLPFAAGACAALGGNVVQDAFGVVAMVAMTPLITIQILGVVFKIRRRRALPVPVEPEDDIIIEME